MTKAKYILLTFVLGIVPSVMTMAQETPEWGYEGVHETLNDYKKVRWQAPRKAKSQLPAAVDNSTLKYFPPIINQRGGSCAQASGIGYTFTYEINRLLDRDASASADNRMSYFFTWNFLNDGKDQGGFVDQGLFLAVRYGVMTEADYGNMSTYQFKWASGYEKYLKAMRYRGKQIYKFPATTTEDLEHIKQYLYAKADGHAHGGVLTFSTLVTGWKLDENYEGPSETGYHSMLTALGRDGAHALTIVGYDDKVVYTDKEGQKHEGAFIVVNSWGKTMHDRGHFYIPYYFFTHRPANSSVNNLGDSMTGVEAYIHEPKLVYKVRLKYTSRNDIALMFGGGDMRVSSSPKEQYTSLIISNQGGDYPMPGDFTNDGILEFALDFTEHLPQPDYQYPTYFLRILRSKKGNKSGNGELLHFSVMDYREKGNTKEYTFDTTDMPPMKWGMNTYMLPTFASYKVSANANRWLDNEGKLLPQNYLLRTADGKFAKMQMISYDAKSGKLTLNYVYQHDGTIHFKERE